MGCWVLGTANHSRNRATWLVVHIKTAKLHRRNPILFDSHQKKHSHSIYMDNQKEYEFFVNDGHGKSFPVKVKGNMPIYQFQAKINQEFHIPPQYQLFAVSRKPKVTNVNIIGDLLENAKVKVIGTVNKGGTDGSSRVQWYKSNSSTLDERNLEALCTPTVAKAFRIPLGAVGCYIVAKFTPMSPDGLSGEPAFVISDRTIESLPPKVNFIEIIGNYHEGEIFTASYGYVGGHEGKSIFNWYIHEHEDDFGSPILGVSGLLEYRATKEVIGKFISFQCTPVRDDGVVGEKRIFMGLERILPARPSVRNVRIVGDAVEGITIKGVGDYFGGWEGPSKFEWLRKNMDTGDFLLVSAGTSDYTLTNEDVGCCLTFVYKPINLEGREGKSSSAVSPVVKEGGAAFEK